jgi:hypothetical protein
MIRPSRRAVAIALGAAAILGGAGALAVGLAPRNLARGMPVKASSVRLGDPAAVVNGFIEYSSYAVHTRTENPAWVRVDLVTVQPIGEIRLYNRGDGFLDEAESLMAVDLSRDGVNYRRAGTCPEVFTQLQPCVIAANGEEARYVRVAHRRVVVLSEIEVFEPR